MALPRVQSCNSLERCSTFPFPSVSYFSILTSFLTVSQRVTRKSDSNPALIREGRESGRFQASSNPVPVSVSALYNVFPVFERILGQSSES